MWKLIRNLLIFNLLSINLFAQEYLFPINPGQTCYLAGNVGEIRQQHFHAGLDIAVDIGAKVLCSADGYVSKVKVSSFGYGKVIYVVHPQTNQQTVYGHLDRFNEPIASIVRQKQYKQASFEIELDFKPNEIAVKRGQVIAFSGNTGSSGGPHLHFEVRTMDDIALNPFQFKFSELPKDNLPPLIKKIAFQTLAIQSRINQEFGRVEFPVTKLSAGQYKVNQVIELNNWVGLEVLADDILQGRAGHTYAVNQWELALDGKRIFGADFNQISHENTRSMYVHINFAHYRQSGKGFQKCYISDGNRLINNYLGVKNQGKIFLKDDKIHQLSLKLKDSWGNVSTLNLSVKRGKSNAKSVFISDKSLQKPQIQYFIQENTLLIVGKNLKKDGQKARLSFNGLNQILPLAYQKGTDCVYLWDLRDGLPDLVEVDGLRKPFYFKQLIPSGQAFHYQEKHLKITFPATALFDTLYLETQTWHNFVRISSTEIPLFEKVKISYSPLNQQLIQPKTNAYWNSFQLQEGNVSGKKIDFSTRNLGVFALLNDFTAPIIKLNQKKPDKISFIVKDNQSEIVDFKATLDGKFLLLNYEYKQNLLFSEKQNQDQILKGDLVLWVKDGAGNENVFKVTL
jgi:hypothetical protein